MARGGGRGVGVPPVRGRPKQLFFVVSFVGPGGGFGAPRVVWVAIFLVVAVVACHYFYY